MLAHNPVLLTEAIENLAIKAEGIYIDGTFGLGGHSRAILDKLGGKGRLLAIDRDPAAVAAGRMQFAHDKRFAIEGAAFSALYDLAKARAWLGRVDGVLLDLGVSSPQLDDAQRGFSFMRDGPLDMRMNPTAGVDAATWLARAKKEEIAEVLKTYGEERYARRIAQRIVEQRSQAAITTTSRLVEIIKSAIPGKTLHKHPATRSFQAIRIFINNELHELQAILATCLDVLTIGGRLAVISFHSLEDRIVKRFMQQHAQGDVLPKRLPIKKEQIHNRLRRINGAIKASTEEIKRNSRARSAILRIGEKLA